MEATKNITCAKSKSAVGQSMITRWFTNILQNYNSNIFFITILFWQCWKNMNEMSRKVRYQRLQVLLEKCNAYTQYLLQRMKRQEEEEARNKKLMTQMKARQERRREEKLKLVCENLWDQFYLMKLELLCIPKISFVIFFRLFL